ncbi:MAG TPA: hypothetical protein VGX23_34760 [Actinocrinis sp.]|nr:hypothetical protein [Actinocrinis sp.]
MSVAESTSPDGPGSAFGGRVRLRRFAALRQTNYATTAPTFTLPGLSMSFQSKGC